MMHHFLNLSAPPKYSTLLLYKQNHERVRNMGCPISRPSNLCVSVLREYRKLGLIYLYPYALI